MREGLACTWLKLRDEDRQRLISFQEARRSLAAG
jgi:hypothetical protein